MRDSALPQRDTVDCLGEDILRDGLSPLLNLSSSIQVLLRVLIWMSLCLDRLRDRLESNWLVEDIARDSSDPVLRIL
jgi:hypothetical protein